MVHIFFKLIRELLVLGIFSLPFEPGFVFQVDKNHCGLRPSARFHTYVNAKIQSKQKSYTQSNNPQTTQLRVQLGVS